MNTANGGNILFHFKGDDSGLKSTISSIGGMTKSILVATGITKALSTAWNMVSSSTGDAIDRFDQLNAFPKVMSSLGVGTEEAEKAVKTLSERLKGLPTTLNQGTSAVSRFVATNGDVEKSTEMFLALNNAILAGNAPMENQAAALEQITQAYSKGKPDMMEWRSLLTAMPGQLKQVAKAMGYVDTNELHDALIDGSASMDEFMETIIRLDKEGGEGFASFQDQAKNAVGGIQTAITNMKTAVARGVESVISSLDKGLKKGNIEGGINGVIGKIGEGFEKGLGEIGKLIGENLSGLLSGEKTPGEVGGNLINFLAEGIKTGLTFLKEKIPEYVPILVEFLSGMISALGENLPDLVPLALEVVVKLVEALTTPENMQKMGEAGSKLIEGLGEGLVNGVSSDWFQEFCKNTIVNNIKNIFLGGWATDIGHNIILGIATGIAEMLGVPQEQIEQDVKNLNFFHEHPIQWFFETGKQIIQGIINGITSMFNSKKPGKETKKEIKNNVGTDSGSWLYDIGRNIIQGLINGVMAQYWPLVSVANQIASIVGNIIANKNKIHSPSRLMEWYGEMMGEGYVIGLENMQDVLKKTAIETFSLSPQLANSMSLNNSPNVQVNTYVNQQTDPLGQTVSQIKTFANGAKNDYNYGMGMGV